MLPGNLPAPVVDADVATYADVPFAGVDLQVRALADGFSHSFVVRTAAAAADPRLARLDLRLGGSGLAVAADGQGGLTAKDPGSGGVLFQAATPRMWDSTQGPAQASPGARSAPPSEEVQKEFEKAPGMASKVADLEATVSGDRLTLEPDRGLLTDPSARLPIVIDPSWRTPKSTSAVMVNTDNPTDTSWADEGQGLCDNADPHMSNCGGDGKVVKRLFYNFKPMGWVGQYILAAEFEVNEVHAYNCTPSWMEVWRTKQASGSTGWNGQNSFGGSGFWQQKLAAAHVAYGNEAYKCNNHTVEFRSPELKGFVQSLDNDSTPTLTFGLKAANEGSVTGWKRFTNSASLRLVVNVPPDQPRMSFMKVETSGGIVGPCRPYDNPLITTKRPTKFQAAFTDPNVGEKLQGEAEVAWDDGGGWEPHITGLKSDVRGESDDYNDPTIYTFAVPGTVPVNKVVGWHARAHDFQRDKDTGQVTDDWQGTSYWSHVPHEPNAVKHNCHFIVDTARPPEPKITSADGRYPSYPGSTAWHGGPGAEGRFNFTAASTAPQDKPKSYRIQFTDWSGPREVNADGNGNLNNYAVSPTSGGEKWLIVEAKDWADRTSATAVYQFRVNHQAPYDAYWRLDETAGTQAVNEMDTDRFHLQLKGTDHRLGESGKIGTTWTFNTNDTNDETTGYAETAQRVVDASKSYTVAAWVKLDNIGSWSTAVSQDGPQNSSFYLQYSKDDDRWAMAAPGIRALSANPPSLNRWTHLAGVYDANAQQFKLYVNGKHEGTSGTVPAWSAADGPFAVGRGKSGGGNSDYFPGAVDDVRVKAAAVDAAQVQRWFYGTVSARWKLDTLSDGLTVDDTGIALNMKDQAAIGGADRCGGLMIDAGCLVLGDPRAGRVGGDYAAMTGPLVPTDRSFTVAGHVLLSVEPDRRMSVFSQAASVTSGFTVRFDPDAAAGAGAWQIAMPDRDAADATVKTVEHQQCRVCDGQNAPDHLALVYDDAPEKTLSLYVNGLLSQQVTSTRGDVTGFNAGGGFQIGATRHNGSVTEFFGGTVDDVWVYQGALSQPHVQLLARGQSGLTRENAP